MGDQTYLSDCLATAKGVKDVLVLGTNQVFFKRYRHELQKLAELELDLSPRITQREARLAAERLAAQRRKENELAEQRARALAIKKQRALEKKQRDEREAAARAKDAASVPDVYIVGDKQS